MRSIFLIGLAALAAATSAAAQPATSPATQPPAGAGAQAPATTEAPATSAPSGAPAGAMAAPGSTASASVAVGQPVKDNTGVTIGKVTKVSPGPGGKQTAVIAMGAESFAVDTSALAVQNGAAVINASQSEIQGMIAKSSPK